MPPTLGADGVMRLSRRESSVVPLHPEGRKEPLFLVHGVDGRVSNFEQLAAHLEPDQPVYGIQSQALLGDRMALTRVEELAAYYLKDVHAACPQGPYHLLGFSYGALVAFEMARQLDATGEPVGMLGMLDNREMSPLRLRGNSHGEDGRKRRWITSHLARLLSSQGFSYAKEKVQGRGLRIIYTVLDRFGRPIPQPLRRAYDINWFAAVRYVPQRFGCRVTLFQPAGARGQALDQWKAMAGNGLDIREIPGTHENLLAEPHVRLLARQITESLAATGGIKAPGQRG